MNTTGNTNSKVTILIVDDKPANIFVLHELLDNQDRELLSATNGNDALKLALNKNIDLIILDVQMPDMDGFEVARILKSSARTKEIPIIFASAEMKEHNSVMKGFEEGAVDYLSKPLNPEITKAKVSVLLKIQLQKRELLEKNKSLEKSALLINNSPDIIAIINPATFEFEEINNALTSLLGYSTEEIKRLPLTSFIHQDDMEAVKKLKDPGSQSLLFENRVHCKDKTEKWLQWNVIIKEEKWFVNARDITPQKIKDAEIRKLNSELQHNLEQLKSINSELEAFSYSVSHDLRSPLRAMNGYAKILQEDYGDKLDADAGQLLADIQKNALKMNGLIDDLLKFSKLGRKEMLKSEIDMSECVDKSLAEINNSTPHSAKIRVSELMSVYGDSALLTQVWINLISNAIKYSSKTKDPEIEIGSRREAGQFVYFIRDNGAGFDMAYADKLFGVFQRLHGPQEFEGTGIGLAIIQRIIKRHGGKVWAEGKVDEGATFYFSLPSEIPSDIH
jgi:PAS domain S-box-containing protein